MSSLVLFAVFSSPSLVAQAQEPSSAEMVPAPVSGPPAPIGPSESSTVAPLAEPTPPAPAFTAVVSGVPIRLLGILHGMVVFTQGVQSFGLPTANAPTAALNPVLVRRPEDLNLTFQVQQTRLGMVVGEGTEFRGQVEIDFIHFDQSSPTTQAFPRIRIGLLEWHFAENQALFLGQTWDLFGNATGPQLLSHSFNLVGTLFQAGNIGFMRQQLGWSGRFGELEIATAVGLQGANSGPTFNDIEKSATPTLSARLMLHLGERSVIGISGLGTALRVSSGIEEERRLALAGNLFGDLTFGSFNLHTEVYVAQNVANMGSLNLSQGRFGHDVADVGGYVSGRIVLGDHAITAMAGAAALLDASEAVPGYTPAFTMIPSPVPATPNTAAGPGIEYNCSVHVGYWYSPVRGLSFVLEPYAYFTRFVLDAADAINVAADRMSFGGMLGSMFQF